MADIQKRIDEEAIKYVGHNLPLQEKMLMRTVFKEGANFALSLSNWIEMPEDSCIFDVKYLQNKHWLPKEDDLKTPFYREQYEIWQEAEKDVLYDNVVVHWESCDCGGEYGCVHPNYWHRITFLGHPNIKLEDDGDRMIFNGNDNLFISVDYSKMTMGEFERYCQILGIKLSKRTPRQ